MKSLIAITFLALSSTAFSQGWMQTDTLPFANRYDDVYFIDDMRGWAVNSNGSIFKTTDGGAAWREVLPVGVGGYMRSIEFINDSIGFAGDLDENIFRTSDAGETWQNISDSILGNFDGLCGLSHVNDHVFGVGLYSGPSYFIKSTDGGIHWTYTSMSGYADGLVDCHFTSSLHGFVSGTKVDEGAIILETFDGGETWEQVFFAPYNYAFVWKLFFVNEQVGYGSIEDFAGDFAIARTLDGGDTWEHLEGPDGDFDIQGIGFDSPMHGWASPRVNNLYETFDGGETWDRANVLRNINRFFQVPGGRLYASGNQVYFMDDDTAIEDPVAPHYYHTLRVDPNPFANTFTIEVQIDVATDAQVGFFPMTGNGVEFLFKGKMPTGIHTFTVDADQLARYSSQQFVVFLATDEGFHTQKVVRINR